MQQKAQGDNFTFQALWRNAMKERGSRYLHQVLSPDPGKRLVYNVNTAVRIAMKIADGLKQVFPSPRGTCVAVMAEGYGELFALYHGLWLAGFTVVSVPSYLPPDVSAAILNNADAKLLVYSPALSARLASIVPLVSTITHWMVVGGARAAPLGAGRAMIRMDELLQSGSRSVKIDDFTPPRATEDSPPALIAFTAKHEGEPHGVAFSEQALTAAAKQQAYLYFIGSDKERVTSLLPDKHLVSLLHMLLVPLAGGIASVEFSEFRFGAAMPKLMEELYDNQITGVWIDESMLGELRHLSKAQRFALPAEFRVFLLPTRPITAKHLEGIADVLVPCYGQTEAGGVVTAGTKGEIHLCESALRGGTPLLGAGSPLAGVRLKLLSERGETVSGEKQGELVVVSPQVMSGYDATTAGGAYLGPDQSLHTGDRARWSFDAAGKPHLVPLGRDGQFVKRGGKEVNILDLESVLLRVVGVKDARVVPFDHTKYGQELAAFIIVIKKAQVTQENLWSNLLEFFPWDVVPKIFMLADGAQVSTIPSIPELQSQLARFAGTDFSKAPKK